MLGGCASGDPMPHGRLGALPFPGMFTLYTSSEISELGLHRYTSWETRLFEEGEGARGIMYTRRGGFLDLAHIRLTIDWTRYLWKHSRTLLEKGGGSFAFDYEDARYELSLKLPEWWSTQSEAQRALLIDSAAVRIAQRAAYELQTWHEIATWYGWETIPPISAKGSAFTWEDTASHVLGVAIGGAVLAGGDDDYDARTQEALQAAILALDPVCKREVDRAARAVEGRWWKDGLAIKRDLDLGLESGRKTPWLVEGFDAPRSPTSPTPAAWTVPLLTDVNAIDMSTWYTLRIRPSGGVLRSLRAVWKDAPEQVSTQEYGVVLGLIRAEMEERWGAGFGEP